MSALRRVWKSFTSSYSKELHSTSINTSLIRRAEDEHLLSDDGEFDEEPETTETEAEDGTYTIEDAVDHMGFGLFQIKVLAISGLFTITDALEMQLLAVLSPMVRCEWALSEWKVAFITTTVFVGMFMGSHVWGLWADKYGRRPILIIAASWISYFGLATTFSPSYMWLIVLRGLVGLGFGGAVQSFTLLSEYIPSKYRAKALVISSVTWAVGTSFEILMAYFVLPTLGWRYLVAFSALPSFLSLFCLSRMPESVRYLMAAGRKAEAISVLEDVARMNRTTLPKGTLVHSQLAVRGSFKKLFSKLYARTSLQLWLIWFATAFCYYGIILAQSEILEFRKVCGAGLPKHIAEQSNKETCYCNLLHRKDYISIMIATFGEYFAIPLNLLTIDYLGRRHTLSINFAATALFFLLIQLCTSRFWLSFIIFGVRAFGSGVFNTAYIYTSEVYPTTVRSLGLGSCSACARLGAMLTPFVAQVILQWSLVAALWMYGGICLLCAVVAFLLPIETRGRVMPQTHNQ